MARLKKGDRVGGGEWIHRAGWMEPVYGVVLQVRSYYGDGAVPIESCLAKFDDGYQGWLPWTHLPHTPH